MISHLSLQKKNSLSKSVSLQCNQSGFEFLIIEHAKFDAAFARHGAHLLHFQLKGEAPVLWLSKTAIYNEHKAIRGGVPICWPWFANADKSLGDNLPAHGFARISQWSIDKIDELIDGVKIEWLLEDNQQTRKIWPYSFSLRLKATLTDTVKLELITKNTGTAPFYYSGALHTYFNISAPESCLVSGLSGRYVDKLDNCKLEIGPSVQRINKPTDSIYEKATGTIVLSDNQFKRKLHIVNSGNDSDMLWTPWIKGAQAFPDMPDEGYLNMLCIEPAITSLQGKTVAAGQTHTLSTIISQTL